MGMGMDWLRLLNLAILLNLIQTPVQTSRFSKQGKKKEQDIKNESGKRPGMGRGTGWARMLNLGILLNLIQTPVPTPRFSKQ